MVKNSGVFPSIHENCSYQIIFAKINLIMLYPPPYTRRPWDYGKANHKAISNAFDWEKSS